MPVAKTVELSTTHVRIDNRPDDRNLDIYRLYYVDGWTQQQIADEYELHRSRVTQIVKEVNRWRVATWHKDIQAVKIAQQAKIDNLYREAYAGFKRSQDDTTKKREADTSDSKGGSSTKETVKTSSAGDPRWLGEMRAAIQQTKDLWGLDAPKRKEISGSVDLNVGAIEQLADDDLAGIASASEALRVIETTASHVESAE